MLGVDDYHTVLQYCKLDYNIDTILKQGEPFAWGEFKRLQCFMVDALLPS